jgi:MFS family permease
MKPSSVFYGWWIVIACFLIRLYLGGAIFLGFTAVLEPIAKEYGWSYAQVSLAASLRGIEVGLLAPVTGLLVDRWGPRKLIFLGAVIAGLGLIFLTHVSSLVTFYGAFTIIAIGISALGPTVLMTAVVNWFREKVGIATGIVSSGFALGGLMVPLITLLTDKFTWQTAMLYLGLGMWIMVLPLSLIIRHKPEQYGYMLDGNASSSKIARNRSTSVQEAEVDIPTRQALASRAFWHIVLSSLCHTFLVSAVVTHIMPYLSSIGIARSTASLAAGALAVASISGRLGFGWLGDRLCKRWIYAIGFTVLALGLLFFGYVATAGGWLLVPFIILYSVGWGGNWVMRMALIREYFGRSKFGTILGFVSGIMMLGQVSGAPLAGWVFDRWGSYQGIWFVLAGVAITGLVLVLTMPPLTKHN